MEAERRAAVMEEPYDPIFENIQIGYAQDYDWGDDDDYDYDDLLRLYDDDYVEDFV